MKKQQVVIYITLITNVKALISAFYIIGNCLTPIITEKKLVKEVGMFLIDHNVH